jgi:hypothetical protein
VIVAVVVAYLVSEGMTAYVDSRVRPGHQDAETV